MSSFYRPAYHPPTGTVRNALWADDYFGRHQYAVLFDGDETAYEPEQVRIPSDKVFVPLSDERNETQFLKRISDGLMHELYRTQLKLKVAIAVIAALGSGIAASLFI